MEPGPQQDPGPSLLAGGDAPMSISTDLALLQSQTLGDPRVCVAILDGPVDLAHASFRGANLSQRNQLPGKICLEDPASRHGTHITSILFGQSSGLVNGIAPRCRGLSIPIFSSLGHSIQPCSLLDLARAISTAVQLGAHVVNISGGQFATTGTSSAVLEQVVRECALRDILIIAAAGNEGCACWHVPAALQSVLAVGAMDARGQPLDFSNWGHPYQTQGILAPGERILGARSGGGTVCASGTSYATAVVSGIAALLLSLQCKMHQRPRPQAVRAALLQTALGCEEQSRADCRRLLAGRINVNGAMSFITNQEASAMSEAIAAPMSDPSLTAAQPGGAASLAVQPSDAAPSACGCQTCQGTAPPPQMVYVLGQLGYDLVNEARLDSLSQSLAGTEAGVDRSALFDPRRLLGYLATNPWDAAAVEWTLILDGSPVYAIRPRGPFAAETYEELRDFLQQQLDEGVERVSIPGTLAGKATLLMGQVVPVIEPDLRGMRSWTTRALIAAVAGPAPGADAAQHVKDSHEEKKAGLHDFLDRVYHEHRNLGMMPQERALNFAATNAYQVEKVYEAAMKEDLDLESINVTRSPICRPGSDCWDVELYFFYPERQVQTVRKVYRMTVDVSDIVPVTVGPTRSWFTR